MRALIYHYMYEVLNIHTYIRYMYKATNIQGYWTLHVSMNTCINVFNVIMNQRGTFGIPVYNDH